MKRYIICATDFEPEAFIALRYACMLSRQMQCDITLLHVETVSLFIGAAVKTVPDYREQFQDQIKRIALYYPDIQLDTACVKGAVIEGINDYISANGDPIMVVTGNKYNAVYNLVPNSNLVPMLRYVKAPVISVPYLSDLVGVKRLAFAFDNNFANSITAFNWLRQFCMAWEAELHILIGWNDMISYDNSPVMHPEAESAMAGIHYKLHFFKKEQLADQLVHFVQSSHFDILCVLPRHHNLVASAFHQSMTKQLFMNSHLPLLALHEDKW